jgi:hypothetical protein
MPVSATASPGGCRGQASRAYQRWKRISASSSLLGGYDEPEILRSSSCQICLTGAEAGHYCYGIRHERRLSQEVTLHLAYRSFCKLDLDDKVPHHSTFSDANASINHSRIEPLAIWETQDPEYPADLPDTTSISH